jgi:hypothetical protein
MVVGGGGRSYPAENIKCSKKDRQNVVFIGCVQTIAIIIKLKLKEL